MPEAIVSSAICEVPITPFIARLVEAPVAVTVGVVDDCEEAIGLADGPGLLPRR